MRDISSQDSSTRHRHANSPTDVQVEAPVAKCRYAVGACRIDEQRRCQPQRLRNGPQPVVPLRPGMGKAAAKYAPYHAVVEKMMGSKQHITSLSGTSTRLQCERSLGTNR